METAGTTIDAMTSTARTTAVATIGMISKMLTGISLIAATSAVAAAEMVTLIRARHWLTADICGRLLRLTGSASVLLLMAASFPSQSDTTTVLI